MTKKILAAGIFPEGSLDLLADNFDLDWPSPEIERDQLLAVIDQYDGVILQSIAADRELLDKATNLKIISTNGTGYDHIDTAYAKEKGVVVTNCPHSVQVPTAETALTLLLATTKRLSYYDKLIRRGEWVNVNYTDQMAFALEGATIGIHGLGGVGLQLARMLQVLGVKIIYNNISPSKAADELGCEYVDFENLLAQSDAIVVLLPLTEKTRYLYDKLAFSQMKESAYFINMARGPIVRDEDLIAALKNNEIAGAGLDVFDGEPNVNPGYFELDNVIMTPHIGTGTLKARTAMAQEGAQNIYDYFVNGTTPNQVNK